VRTTSQCTEGVNFALSHRQFLIERQGFSLVESVETALGRIADHDHHPDPEEHADRCAAASVTIHAAETRIQVAM
jgi:hypothetical protein